MRSRCARDRGITSRARAARPEGSAAALSRGGQAGAYHENSWKRPCRRPLHFPADGEVGSLSAQARRPAERSRRGGWICRHVLAADWPTQSDGGAAQSERSLLPFGRSSRLLPAGAVHTPWTRIPRQMSASDCTLQACCVLCLPTRCISTNLGESRRILGRCSHPPPTGPARCCPTRTSATCRPPAHLGQSRQFRRISFHRALPAQASQPQPEEGATVSGSEEEVEEADAPREAVEGGAGEASTGVAATDVP